MWRSLWRGLRRHPKNGYHDILEYKFDFRVPVSPVVFDLWGVPSVESDWEKARIEPGKIDSCWRPHTICVTARLRRIIDTTKLKHVFKRGFQRRQNRSGMSRSAIGGQEGDT